jgi:NDP-sugar pyrophosphorylase family protein
MTGKGIYAYETKGKFIDIGTPKSYAQAEKFFHQPSIPT